MSDELPPGYGYEMAKALFEARCIVAADAYFAARPTLDCKELRRLFEQAFERGYYTATTGAAQ